MQKIRVLAPDPVIESGQVVQVIENRLADRREDYERWAGNDDKQPEQTGKPHIQLTEALDSFVQSSDD